MSPVTVFEDPWPKTRKQTPLEEAAAQHVQVVGFFLKLLPYFPRDENGHIANEALVYSEWRYIVYIRFLQISCLSPHERPPPWDVAMIWYCHLMSPARFHRHLADARHVSLGLYYMHFPLSELSALLEKKAWSHRKAKADWDSFSARVKYALPYQLWSTAPWDQAPGKLFRLLGLRNPSSNPTRRLSKLPQPSSGDHTETQIYMPHDYGRRCAREDAFRWPLAEYTSFRSADYHTGTPDCQLRARHLTYGEECELEPWPTVDHLRSALARQIAFWRAVSKAQGSQPGFVSQLPSATGHYANFMGLFRGSTSGGGTTSRFDPRSGTVTTRLTPPTLEVGLLWRTHRLFPGCYWPWCDSQAGRLVDCEAALETEEVKNCLGRTRQLWRDNGRLGAWPAGSSMEEWVDACDTDLAVLAPSDAARKTMQTMLIGYFPYRKMRAPTRSRRGDASGGGSSVTGGGGSGGDGGGGGGDGGGG